LRSGEKLLILARLFSHRDRVSESQSEENCRVLAQFGLSFTPRLQPGDQLTADLGEPFQRLSAAISRKTVETVHDFYRRTLTTGLKPRCE